MSDLPQVETVNIANRHLTVARFGTESIRIVMIHDGLGSISQWREVPALIAEATGVGVLVYDRAGHGQSELAQEESQSELAQEESQSELAQEESQSELAQEESQSDHHAATWLHEEAAVLGELLAHYQVEDPLLVGHSDGGSIGLIHAAETQACRGLVTLAAHSFVEEVCVTKIFEMRATAGPIVFGLARHHKAPQQLFEAWSGVWTSPEFRTWDIRPTLGAITCPVLVVQGQADDYATDSQLTDTVSAIGANAAAMRVAGVGHVLHHEVPDQVIELVSNFFQRLM